MTLFNINKDIETLRNRVRDLERTAEIMMGANSVLQQELEKAQHREAILQEKLFDVLGINERNSVKKEKELSPILLNKKTPNWGQLRHDLEKDANTKYWEDKKRDQEAKDGIVNSISELEKQLDIAEK